MMPPDTDLSWMSKQNWVDLRDGASLPLPLWLKEPQNEFWFEYLADSKTMYVQLNQVGDKDTETLADFSKRLFAFVDDNTVEKLILDLRLNRGATRASVPLVTGIINPEDRQQEMFRNHGADMAAALSATDRIDIQTVSLASLRLEGNLTATSVRITLQQCVSVLSIILAGLASVGYAPVDSATSRGMTSDYRANHDPAMKAILNYVPQKPLAEVLEEALTKDDLAEAVKRLRQFRKDPANLYSDTEVVLMSLGYRLLLANKLDQAVGIFKLSAEDNPRSADSYELLGDAYAKMGNKELAIKSYEKSLELDPRDLDVVENLKKLKQK